jgi:hypothetical protein
MERMALTEDLADLVELTDLVDLVEVLALQIEDKVVVAVVPQALL